MDHQQIKNLKAAMDRMDQVVSTLQYHNKLRNAWKNLKVEINRMAKPDGPRQTEMFGSRDA